MVYGKETHYPLTEEEAYQLVFEEARLVFSGMIYGYRFTYTPFDKTRGVEEYFALSPLAEISWGDKNLRLVYKEVSDNRLWARFVYELEKFQEARIESWQTLSIPYDMGSGEGKIILGMKEKDTAREMAVKEAIRNHLRPKILNKPREITGEVLLLEGPSTVLRAGTYSTTVKVKIDIKEIIPYTIY